MYEATGSFLTRGLVALPAGWLAVDVLDPEPQLQPPVWFREDEADVLETPQRPDGALRIDDKARVLDTNQARSLNVILLVRV